MIVTLDQVKAHLRIDGTDEDAYLATLQAGAEAAVLNYLKIATVDALAVGSPPAVPEAATDAITAAVLIMCGYLYRNRDNDEEKEFDRGYLPRPITALLCPLRDPSLS